MPSRSHRGHLALHLRKRLPTAIALPESASVKTLVDKPLSGLSAFFKRDDCSGSNSHSSACQKPTDGNNVTLPVALAVVIPIVVAIGIFVFLHRKHLKKLRHEDANDPHKSLDFGWDPASTARANTKKGKKSKPEMVTTDVAGEKALRREHGMSMDMDISSPYLLPPGLGGSRESLHSMSRTMHSQDDRYRPATTYIPGDATSVHSHRTGRRGADDSSSYTRSSSIQRNPADDMKNELLPHAQRMSRSVPPVSRSPAPQIQVPEAAKQPSRVASPSVPQSANLAPNYPLLDTPRDSYMDKNGAELRKSNNYLGAFIHSREPSADVVGRDVASPKSEYATPKEFPSTPSSMVQQSAPSPSPQQPAAPSPTLQRSSSRKSPPPNIITAAPTSKSPPPPPPNTIELPSARSSSSRPPRKQSLRSSTEQARYENFLDDTSDYGDGLQVVPPSLRSSQGSQPESNHQSGQAYMPPIHEHGLGLEDGHRPGFDPRRSSMGVRPLPPDDPTDNPEQRANRIRSFYKEYFDDSRPAPMSAGDYYEDYDSRYLGDGAIFDPASGGFVTAQNRGRQYTEPYGRRAMTPPPRAPPGYGRRHAATMSGSSRNMPPRSRAYSSHSARFGPSGRSTPQRPVPPPQPLNVLPSPHLLKEDTFLPMDFAPPATARERQAGRSESPRGGLRPYSPSVAAHMPLVSSFDDLAPMPSPHLLRKSGTFTALDFAPPPRFRNNDTGSDSGSIRSNHSGVSARTNQSIRAGAYRVSRIPKEFVGTKQDLNEALKPQWNMHAL